MGRLGRCCGGPKYRHSLEGVVAVLISVDTALYAIVARLRQIVSGRDNGANRRWHQGGKGTYCSSIV